MSFSASRTSACWESSIASSKTVGLDIVAYMISANEAQLPAWTSIHHRARGGSALRILVAVVHGLLRPVPAVRLPAAAHRAEKEELDVVRIVLLVIGRQRRRVVRRDRPDEVGGHDDQQLRLVALV